MKKGKVNEPSPNLACLSQGACFGVISHRYFLSAIITFLFLVAKISIHHYHTTFGYWQRKVVSFEYQVRKAAIIPTKKMPSNTPAPPMLST